MDSSQFTDNQSRYETIEQMETQGATCDTFRVKLYGKLHFLKRLKTEHVGDIRYQEALRKEFETGYRLEHPNLVRYLSLDNNSILMEYVDGETLSQRIASHPDYFKNRKNTDKFVRQLLDVLGYLHSHQVLHLDLKPDNILLTHINDDVKLIDLGCCYTDTFTDTTGRTESYAAPEQLAGNETDVRTDIYALGKILELLPNHHIYNKVIARCTAENPSDRYQSITEVAKAINNKSISNHILYVLLALLLVVAVIVFVLLSQGKEAQQEQPIVLQESTTGFVVPYQKDSDDIAKDTIRQVVTNSERQSVQLPQDEQTQLKKDADRLIDEAYKTTIATFCDSIFPPRSPSSGKAWKDASTELRNQTIQIANRLSKKYPQIPENTIRQDCESRFQSLVSSVFNQMRANAQQ